MKNVQVLDCTLRDGGRIINCKFEDMTIYNIANELTESGIDIVELGFLRSTELVNYDGNSTFFTDVSQMSRFIPQNKKNTTYVAFIDYNMYNFEDLKECDNTSVTGIRVGFTKKQYLEDIAGIKKALYTVKEKGYKLFIQTVNSLAYSDKDMLNLIDMVNEIQPYSFGIVDTYGAMYLEDIIHYYNVVDYNLNLKIGPAAKSRFPKEILDEYVRCLRDPMTFHGICEDYRASATIDMEMDKADREQIIQVPVLALWGKDGVVGKLWDVMSGWQERAANVEGFAVNECGHFVPEEQPEVVLEAMLQFLAKYPA